MICYDKPIKVSKHKTLGYLYFYDREHPLADSYGIVYHHRHIASITLGRWLTPNEHVHHYDKNRENNIPSNLKVVTVKEHMALHYPPLPEVNCIYCNITFKVKKRGQKYCSDECYKKSLEKTDWPTYEELKREVEETSYSASARRFNVSDNAVRKRLRNHKD